MSDHTSALPGEQDNQGAPVVVAPGRCIECGEPFQRGVNVFTLAGEKEIPLTQTCEQCFDGLFDEGDA